MHIQVVNFRLKDMSETEFRTLCDQIAPTIAGIPGLISKVWLSSPATNTYGGVYTWKDREAMEQFAQSELFAAIASNPNFAGITSTDFGVLEGPTRETYGLPRANGLPKFIDFHPNWPVKQQSIERLREETRTGKVDEFGVRQLEFFYNPSGEGAYCLLEAPDQEAARKHHRGNCGEPLRVESLL
jgi:quinol monooxygenase YgiN